jgi:hypothetical protein
MKHNLFILITTEMIFFSYLTDFSYFPVKIVFQKVLDTGRKSQKLTFWKGV